MTPPLLLTEDMARRADRYDRRRLACRAFAAKEADRLRACRERLVLRG
jgi:hypothetical protein